MHDKRLLEAQESTWYQEGSNGLPLGGSNKKKNSKKKVVVVGIFHKPYQWQARDEEKGMVWFVFYLRLGSFDMQGREGKKKRGTLLVRLLQKMKNEEEEEGVNVVLKWVEISCGPHWPQSFKCLKLLSVGLG